MGNRTQLFYRLAAIKKIVRIKIKTLMNYKYYALILLLTENLCANLPAPKPIKPSRTPELVHQQNKLLQQEQQKEYDLLLETLGLVQLISPQTSPQPRKSPHLTQILMSPG